MTEQNQPDPAQDPSGDPPKADETDWKAEARKWETRAKENNKAAERLAQIEEASKSDLQKEREARTAAEKERDGLKLAQLRIDVGTSKGLTVTQSRRLVGSTKEELEKDAEDFLADIKPAEKHKPDPKRLKSGSSTEPASGEKGRAAAALRTLRGSNA